jgi:pimeloyl-ACP methyl ester carboxylesterase
MMLDHTSNWSRAFSSRVASSLVVFTFAYLFLPVHLPVYPTGNTNPSNNVAASKRQNIKEDEVQFKNGDILLAGTLLMPLSEGTHPALVIIHGSGPDEGSEYRVYAEQFARAGIAALLYDKRGSGKSTGDWRYRTLDDLAADALAGVTYLKNRPEINSQQIGLWGISQGSWVVPLAALRSQDVAFVITVAGDGVSPTQQEMYHKDEMFRHLRYSERARDTALKVWKLLFDWVVLVADGKFPMPNGVMEPELSGAYFGLNHDPIPDWEKVSQPALLIYGEEDKLTPVAESIARIDAVFKRTGHRDYTFIVFPKAAHNITLGKTGLEFDWDKGFAPGYFETMNEWVLARARGQASLQRQDQGHQYRPSPNFEAFGRYGRLPWYGRTFPQMGFMFFFALVFVSGLIIWIVGALRSIFRKPAAPSKSVRLARRLAGLVSCLGLALLVGFVIFIAQAVFPQGLNPMAAYTIPSALRFLPLMGLVSVSLILVLLVLTLRSWESFPSKAARLHQALVVLVAIVFIPWLYYWNLIGLWF